MSKKSNVVTGKRTFKDITESAVKFFIRAYQRPYEASSKWIREFLLAFERYANAVKTTNNLQVGMFKETLDKALSIVDGQQRIVTMLIGYIALAHYWNDKDPNGSKALYSRMTSFFTKGGIEYQLSSRDTHLSELFLEKEAFLDAMNDEYTTKSEKSVRKKVLDVYTEWYKLLTILHEDKLLVTSKILKLFDSTKLGFYFLDKDDDEEEEYVRANQNRNPMGLTALCGPYYLKNVPDTLIEKYIDEYDSLSKEYMKVLYSNSTTVYELDHITRLAVLIESGTYIPSIRDSQINPIATSIGLFLSENESVRLLDICKKHAEYVEFLWNPDRFDIAIPSENLNLWKIDSIPNLIKACRSISANGSFNPVMTSADAALTVAFETWDHLRADGDFDCTRKLAEYLQAMYSYFVRKYFAVGGLSDNSQKIFEIAFSKAETVLNIMNSDNIKEEFFKKVNSVHLAFASNEEIVDMVINDCENPVHKLESKLEKVCKSMKIRFPENETYLNPKSFAEQAVSSDCEPFLNDALLAFL